MAVSDSESANAAPLTTCLAASSRKAHDISNGEAAVGVIKGLVAGAIYTRLPTIHSLEASRATV